MKAELERLLNCKIVSEEDIHKFIFENQALAEDFVESVPFMREYQDPIYMKEDTGDCVLFVHPETYETLSTSIMALGASKASLAVTYLNIHMFGIKAAENQLSIWTIKSDEEGLNYTLESDDQALAGYSVNVMEFIDKKLGNITSENHRIDTGNGFGPCYSIVINQKGIDAILNYPPELAEETVNFYKEIQDASEAIDRLVIAAKYFFQLVDDGHDKNRLIECKELVIDIAEKVDQLAEMELDQVKRILEFSINDSQDKPFLGHHGQHSYRLRRFEELQKKNVEMQSQITNS